MPDHIFSDGRLGDIKPELEKFAMDSRGAPERIGQAYFMNQIANVLTNPGTTAIRPRLPPPIGPESLAMPSEQCFRPEERDGINNGGPKPIQPNEGESIEVRQA